MYNLLQQSINSLCIGALTFAIYKSCKIIWFIKYKCYIFKEYENNSSYSVISSFHECVKETCQLLIRKPTSYRVLGMDCEKTSDSGNGNHPVPAILQLANQNEYCAVFKVKIMEDKKHYILSNSVYPSELQLPSGLTVLAQILEDPTILKVGVGILDDARFLENKYGLVTKGCLDVRHLARELNIKPSGLDELGLQLLGQGKKFFKKKANKKSVTWESKNLPEKQLSYAVQDARLGVNIFMELNKRYICHHYSFWERLFWDEKAFWKYTIKLCEKFVGKQFNINKDENTSIKCDSWLKYIHDRIYDGFFTPIYVLQSGLSSCDKCNRRGFIETLMTPVVPVDYNIGNPAFRDLCKLCLEINRKENYIIREKLTEMCGAPYPDYEDTRLIKAKNLATNILNSTDKQSDQYELSQFRLCEMLDISRKQLDDETLEVILTMDCWPGSSHGQFVHDYFENFQQGKLDELRRFWEHTRMDLCSYSRY